MAGFMNAGGWSGRAKKLFSIVPFIRLLNSICKQEKPDLIHAHASFLVGLAAWLVAKLRGIPYVYEVRSTWEEDIRGGAFIRLQRALIRFLERLAIRLADGRVFISKGLVEHYCIGTYGKYKDGCLSIIYNCVKQPDRTLSTREENSEDRLKLGYIGALRYYEGVEYLIRACRQLKDRGVVFELMIVGDGETRTELETLTDEMGLGDVVKFVGQIPSEQVASYYEKVDMIILPRKNLLITNRVAGLKPVEAFSYGKLVIAADVGGMRELFEEGVHGLFFEAENVSSLVEKIIWARENPGAVKGMVARANILYKQRFTLETMGYQYKEIYDCVVA
jgi:glycosyltransferase involved in cell wall biosynthesis